MYELYITTATRNFHKFIETAKQERKEGKLTLKLTSLGYSLPIWVFYMLFYFVWIFIGLFSFQWIVFLILFLISCMPNKQIWNKFLNGIFSLLILSFIVLNAYHFQIDVTQLILSVFK